MLSLKYQVQSVKARPRSHQADIKQLTLAAAEDDCCVASFTSGKLANVTLAAALTANTLAS